MKGYFRFPLMKNIYSSIIFGDIDPENDFACGISYYINPVKEFIFVK